MLLPALDLPVFLSYCPPFAHTSQQPLSTLHSCALPLSCCFTRVNICNYHFRSLFRGLRGEIARACLCAEESLLCMRKNWSALRYVSNATACSSQHEYARQYKTGQNHREENERNREEHREAEVVPGACVNRRRPRARFHRSDDREAMHLCNPTGYSELNAHRLGWDGTPRYPKGRDATAFSIFDRRTKRSTAKERGQEPDCLKLA